MAAPVWVLSVDLQTKTATFATGMGDAAKSARGAFNQIKTDADDAGRGVGVATGAMGGHMMEARHGVMLLGEEFGVHLPRALTSFIASIGPIGAAMEAAFPFLAIAVGVTLLIQHLSKLREEADKAAIAQIALGTTIDKVFSGLDDKLLEAGIKADELADDHIGALQKQLILLDHQSLSELEKTFDTLAKAADAALATMKSHWYEFGDGSAGAMHALNEFKAKYDALLAQGKEKEAGDLLAGTLESARKIVGYQQEIISVETGHGDGDNVKYADAQVQLRKAGLTTSEKDLKVQETVVEALQAQVTAMGKVEALKEANKTGATAKEDKREGAEEDKSLRKQEEADKREAAASEKLWEEAHNRAVEALEESEKEKIQATEEGSQARVNAIYDAMMKEQSYGLQETSYYKSLQSQLVASVKAEATEEEKIREGLAKEALGHEQRMGDLLFQGQAEHTKTQRALRQISASQALADYLQEEAQHYDHEVQTNAKAISALDKNGKDYAVKLKQLQDKQEELARAHENKLTQIADKAAMDRNARIISGERRMGDEVSKSMAQVLTRHESMAKMMTSLGDQMAQGMIQNALQSILANDMTKMSDAKAAARKGFLWGWQHGGPAAPILAPTLGALAFASVMAFEAGGIVPGTGNQDTVPARLTPGEGVFPKKLMEGLTTMAQSGKMSSGGDTHVRVSFAPTIHAIDATGVDKMLQKHADKFTAHVTNELRKRNF